VTRGYLLLLALGFAYVVLTVAVCVLAHVHPVAHDPALFVTPAPVRWTYPTGLPNHG